MLKQILAAAVLGFGLMASGAAMAQTAAPMGAPANDASMNQPPPAWHPNMRREHRAERVGDMYTDALNTLYAHGFHGVHHLSMQNGAVMASAVTPNGARRQVVVHPDTDRISIG